MSLTIVLWGVLVLFAFGDALAHFTGGRTVSWSIRYLERRWPIFHILVGLALAVLFTHLEVGVP